MIGTIADSVTIHITVISIYMYSTKNPIRWDWDWECYLLHGGVDFDHFAAVHVGLAIGKRPVADHRAGIEVEAGWTVEGDRVAVVAHAEPGAVAGEGQNEVRRAEVVHARWAVDRLRRRRMVAAALLTLHHADHQQGTQNWTNLNLFRTKLFRKISKYYFKSFVGCV